MATSDNHRRRVREKYASGTHGNAVYVTVDGKPMTLAAAARARKLPESTVYKRWAAGERDPAKLLRPRRKRRKTPESYRVGLSEREWQQVLDLAHEIGAKKAAEKNGIPCGAVGAMLRGEFWRVT